MRPGCDLRHDPVEPCLYKLTGEKKDVGVWGVPIQYHTISHN